MARTSIGTLSLMLSILLWGVLLGGVAYSHVVYFPVYLSALPASAVIVNGPYGLNDAVFWTLLHPLLILSSILSLVLNWRSTSRRRLIAASAAVYATVLILTALYFVPELIAFQHSPGSDVSPAAWLARGQLWQRLSWLRGATCFAAFIPLLLALTHPGDRGADSGATASA